MSQSETIARLATAYERLRDARYDDAVKLFGQVVDAQATRKFFLHWYWRVYAQLGLCNAWLAAGDLRKARTEADRFLEAVSPTAEPNINALACDGLARVAMAAKSWNAAESHVEQGLAIVEEFHIPTTAWRVHATRSALYRHAKDTRSAEAHRARAEAIVLGLADALPAGDPIRAAFLDCASVRSIRR